MEAIVDLYHTRRFEASFEESLKLISTLSKGSVSMNQLNLSIVSTDEGSEEVINCLAIAFESALNLPVSMNALEAVNRIQSTICQYCDGNVPWSLCIPWLRLLTAINERKMAEKLVVAALHYPTMNSDCMKRKVDLLEWTIMELYLPHGAVNLADRMLHSEGLRLGEVDRERMVFLFGAVADAGGVTPQKPDGTYSNKLFSTASSLGSDLNANLSSAASLLNDAVNNAVSTASSLLSSTVSVATTPLASVMSTPSLPSTNNNNNNSLGDIDTGSRRPLLPSTSDDSTSPSAHSSLATGVTTVTVASGAVSSLWRRVGLFIMGHTKSVSMVVLLFSLIFIRFGRRKSP